MQHQAAQAYQQTAKITVSPRDLEADLLVKAAARLQSVQDDWPAAKDALNGALTYNRRLWTVFATSATAENNPLPGPIKQNIANLGLFVFNQTFAIQRNPAPEKLSAMIMINQEIAAGLRQQAEAARTAEEEMPGAA